MFKGPIVEEAGAGWWWSGGELLGDFEGEDEVESGRSAREFSTTVVSPSAPSVSPPVKFALRLRVLEDDARTAAPPPPPPPAFAAAARCRARASALFCASNSSVRAVSAAIGSLSLIGPALLDAASDPAAGEWLRRAAEVAGEPLPLGLLLYCCCVVAARLAAETVGLAKLLLRRLLWFGDGGAFRPPPRWPAPPIFCW